MQHHFQRSTGELQKLLFKSASDILNFWWPENHTWNPLLAKKHPFGIPFSCMCLLSLLQKHPHVLGTNQALLSHQAQHKERQVSALKAFPTSNRTEHSNFSHEPSNEWDRVLHTSAQRSHVSQRDKTEKGKKMRNSTHLLSAKPLLSEPFQEFLLDN